MLCTWVYILTTTTRFLNRNNPPNVRGNRPESDKLGPVDQQVTMPDHLQPVFMVSLRYPPVSDATATSRNTTMVLVTQKTSTQPRAFDELFDIVHRFDTLSPEKPKLHCEVPVGIKDPPTRARRLPSTPTSCTTSRCVYSSVLQILQIWLGNMVHLQELIWNGDNNAGTDINDFLQQIPSNMAGLIKLKRFSVKNFSKLSAIPHNTFELPCLDSIVIPGCISPSLRNSTRCHARTAQTIVWTSFTLNNTFDDGLDCLTHFLEMRDWSLYWLSDVNYLSVSLSALDYLQSLNLEYIPFEWLPSELSNLTLLTSPCISHCNLLKFDRTDFVMPISLKKLNLRFLPLFKELPITIGNPTKLQELMIERCDLETVPPEICKLTMLMSLHLLKILARKFPRSLDSLVNLKTLHCTSRSRHFVSTIISFFVEWALVLRWYFHRW